jgi:hypothetical protein
MKKIYCETNYNPHKLVGCFLEGKRIVSVITGKIVKRDVKNAETQMAIEHEYGVPWNRYDGDIYGLGLDIFSWEDREDVKIGTMVHVVELDNGEQYNFVTRITNKRIFRPFDK